MQLNQIEITCVHQIIIKLVNHEVTIYFENLRNFSFCHLVLRYPRSTVLLLFLFKSLFFFSLFYIYLSFVCFTYAESVLFLGKNITKTFLMIWRGKKIK